MKNRYIIIMAGGIGSRFWPLSRNDKPKQFLDILGKGETLLQETYRRCCQLCPQENIVIVTNDDHKELVTGQLEINPRRVISEPFRRNTAPCIVYGSFLIREENPDAVIAVTPADHHIEDEEEFRITLNSGFDFASANDSLVTIGIKPDKPETGYGYIQAADKNTGNLKKVMKVKAFTEKPDLAHAKTFIESGDFYWNAGIFVWSLKSILNAFERFLPELFCIFDRGRGIYGTESETGFIYNAYCNLQTVSIDYGILERADNVYVIAADMGWSDLGTWSSLFSHSVVDNSENAVIEGDPLLKNCNRNLFCIPKGKAAIIEGLEDFIVVDTNDALLIIHKDNEQNIKQYLENFKYKAKSASTL